MTKTLFFYCVLLIALTGCRKPPAPTVDASAKGDVTTRAPRVAEAARRSLRGTPDAGVAPTLPDGGADADLPLPSEKELKTLTRRLCGDDPLCCRIDAASAGPDRAGRSMTVLRLDRTCGASIKEANGASEEEGEPCQKIENWLAVHQGPKLIKRQLLSKECNDGYGASGMGEDSTGTTRNLFSANRFGGSAYYWSTAITIVLDPLHIASQGTTRSSRTALGTSDSEDWNWDDFKGRGELSLELCEGEPSTLDAGSEREAPTLATAFVQIPSAALPETFLAGDWKKTTLGRCSVLVDGAEEGFTVHGSGDGADDASLRVVAAGKVLFIEVRDDHWVGPGMPTVGRKWLHDDHLEIWVSTQVSFDSNCATKDQGAPRQWAIRVTDGAVFPAAGHPTELPTVERVLAKGAKGTARFRIELPAGTEQDFKLTVVYSDSDDGKRQKQLIATSQVKFGWAATLGSLKSVGGCVVRKGRLDPDPTLEKFDPQKDIAAIF